MSESEPTVLDAGVLSEIMAKSVKDLTDEDIIILVSALRDERAKFQSGERAGKRVGKSVLTKAAEAPKSPITFEDLGL